MKEKEREMEEEELSNLLLSESSSWVEAAQMLGLLFGCFFRLVNRHLG